MICEEMGGCGGVVVIVGVLEESESCTHEGSLGAGACVWVVVGAW